MIMTGSGRRCKHTSQIQSMVLNTSLSLAGSNLLRTEAAWREFQEFAGAVKAEEESEEAAQSTEVEDEYVAFDLAKCASLLEATLPDVFAACIDKGFGLPHGVETQLRRDQYEDLRLHFGFSPRAPDPVDRLYEDYGFRPLDETAEPLDPEARKMQEYVQDADRPTYQDNM